MQAQLVFAFPFDVSAVDAIHAVANHFAVGVSIAGAPANVPAHIKAAVEAVGAVEPSAAVAFGGLLNGAAGNVPATAEHAPYSAGVATSMTAHAAQPDISATSAPASSAPVQPTAPVAVAPVVSAATASPASNERDSTGLPWDERIHSGNKTVSPSGEWRTKKGVDKSLVASITAQLRAQVGNATSAPVAATAAVVAPASPTNAPASVDPTAKRAAALEFAHNTAIAVCGASPIEDNTLNGLLNGKPATLSPHQNDWYNAYFAKRNAAFAEYMQSGTVVTVAPVASAPAPTAAPQQGELDATGLPHDPRINVGAKIKDAAGVWVQRHDVAPADKLVVIAELRAALAGNVAAQASNTEPAPASTPVAPTPPAAPGITAADAGTDFAKLMQWIVANQIAGRISPTAGPDAAKSLGFMGADGNGQLVLMTQQATFWPFVVQLLQAQGAV